MIYNSWDVSGAIPSLWGRLYATPYPPPTSALGCESSIARMKLLERVSQPRFPNEV